MAGPPSPADAAKPFPAMVVMMPGVFSATGAPVASVSADSVVFEGVVDAEQAPLNKLPMAIAAQSRIARGTLASCSTPV